VDTTAKRLGIKSPKIYLVDKAEPVAFSFSNISPRIFITVGLTELLKPKELQAVLLHELGHIKHKSSFLKFTSALLRLFMPLSSFHSLHPELQREEKEADKVAVSIQGTDRYLLSAKEKINSLSVS
jgi:beta-lactamase regulating signal transducer with metallopeptidase domain